MNLKRAILIAAGSALLALPVFAQSTGPRARTIIVRRGGGYLGIGVVELTDDRAKALNLKDSRGVEVKRVEENSAAAKAGLREDDVILEINGKAVDDVDQFIRSIGEMQPGAKVDMTVWRNGARQTLTATLDSRPRNQFALFGPNGEIVQMPPMPPMVRMPLPPMPPDMDPWSILPGSARVGFEGEALSPQLAEYFGVKQGVLVRTVDPNTAAQKAGLKAGDVVVKVNGTPVTSPREIIGLVRTSRKKSVSFDIVRDKKNVSLDVEVPAEPQW